MGASFAAASWRRLSRSIVSCLSYCTAAAGNAKQMRSTQYVGCSSSQGHGMLPHVAAARLSCKLKHALQPADHTTHGIPSLWTFNDQLVGGVAYWLCLILSADAWQAAHVFAMVQALQVVISHCLAFERLLVVLVHALQHKQRYAGGVNLQWVQHHGSELLCCYCCCHCVCSAVAALKLLLHCLKTLVNSNLPPGSPSRSCSTCRRT